MISESVLIDVAGKKIAGELTIPDGAVSVVVFAHGSGSGRFSPRNLFVAKELNKAGLATLLIDLLTESEEQEDEFTRQFRFDIVLLTERLVGATKWLLKYAPTKKFDIGYFGASTGAAAALAGAAELPDTIHAVVSRGGRPDLAGEALGSVEAPTLLIVGGDDTVVIDLNLEAMKKIKAKKELKIVPRATHLFEEPGKLEEVARLAKDWFITYLKKAK